MFKSTFKYALDSDKGTITLTPTKSLWMKALAPNLILAAGFGLLWLVGSIQEKKYVETLEDHLDEMEK